MKKLFILGMTLFFVFFSVVSFADESLVTSDSQFIANEGISTLYQPSADENGYGYFEENTVPKEILSSLIPQVENLNRLGFVDFDVSVFDRDYKTLRFCVYGGLLLHWEKEPRDYIDAMLGYEEKPCSYFVIGEDSVQAFAYAEYDGKFEFVSNKSPEITPEIEAELRSIAPYMVFDGKICQVLRVIPVTNDGLHLAFFYETDQGTFVKYYETEGSAKWKSMAETKGNGLLFSKEEFAFARESCYGSIVKAIEEHYEKYGTYPVGTETPIFLTEMESVGIELNFCEAGNPVPKELQAEVNALLGIETPAEEENTQLPPATEGTPTTDGTNADPSDGVTSVPTDEGVADVGKAETELPWLWIGMGGGAVVLILATVMIIKKRK